MRRAFLQFGQPEPDGKARDRPAAFGVGVHEGQIALARITREGQAPFLALPGGAIDAGESETRALIREFGEEVGLLVHAGELLVLADQYAVTGDGVAVNNRCAFYEAIVDGLDSRLKIEDTHELVWLTPADALTQLRYEAHAWAVGCWMRAHQTPQEV